MDHVIGDYIRTVLVELDFLVAIHVIPSRTFQRQTNQTLRQLQSEMRLHLVRIIKDFPWV
jgi:hypothetical protein